MQGRKETDSGLIKLGMQQLLNLAPCPTPRHSFFVLRDALAVFHPVALCRSQRVRLSL